MPSRLALTALLVPLLTTASSQVRADELPAGNSPPATTTPAAGGGLQVHFRSKVSGKVFGVTVDGDQTCQTPCSLRLPMGRHTLQVEGDGSFCQEIEVVADNSVVDLEARRSDRLAIGVTGAVLGSAFALGGGLLALSGATKRASASLAHELGRGVGDGRFQPTAAEEAQYSRDINQARTAEAAGVCLAVTSLVVGIAATTFGLSTMGHNAATVQSDDADDAILGTAEKPKLRLDLLAVAPTRGGAMVGASFSF